MHGAVFVGLSFAAGAASVALAWAHVRRVAAVLRADAGALALALKRVPPGDRLRALLDRSEPGTFEHDLAVEALAAPHNEARVAAINAALTEIDHAIASGARWPATGLRLALLGAGLSAFFAYIADPSRLVWPLAGVAVGGVAALACAQAGRSGERLAERQRRAVDALVSAVLALPHEAPASGSTPPDPARRRRR